ncbi:hypothetical protein TNCV_3145341 [Trichonephila clavipes]|nr:hypothetical protein TNCV_3145341 [Trichonephila clavipes]
MPSTSRYNLRPRNETRVESRPTDVMRTQQGESVRARKSGENHYSPYIEEQERSLKQQEYQKTATAGSDVVQSGRPIFDDFFQHLWPYIGNNTANVVFQMVKRLWLIRIDQSLYIASQKIV